MVKGVGVESMQAKVINSEIGSALGNLTSLFLIGQTILRDWQRPPY